MSQMETNKKLANSFVDLKHCGETRKYQAKSKTKRFLNMSFLNTQFCRTQFTKYNCFMGWKDFRHNFSDVPLHHCTYTLIKKLVKDFSFSKY